MRYVNEYNFMENYAKENNKKLLTIYLDRCTDKDDHISEN